VVVANARVGKTRRWSSRNVDGDKRVQLDDKQMGKRPAGASVAQIDHNSPMACGGQAIGMGAPRLCCSIASTR
jgi:hypothetical protein